VPDQQVAAVVRYLPTGALDTGFGNGGKVTTAFPGFAQYKRVVIQRDAKIVAAGSVSDSMTTRYALARYLGAQ
jgi:hypothetical protein